MTDASLTRLELESSIIGCLIATPETAGAMLQTLTEDDFRTDLYRTVFRSIRKLFGDGALINRMTVIQTIGDDSAMEYLDAAISMRVFPANAELYASLLAERARNDRVQEIAMSIATEHDAAAIPKLVSDLNTAAVRKSAWRAVTMADTMVRFFDRRNGTKPDFLDFGISRINRTRMEPGDFMVIAGEPSTGKTALAAQMALKLAEKRKVGFFTLETSTDKLTDRMVAHLTRIPLEKIKENDLTDAEIYSATQCADRLSRLTMELISAAGMNVSDIRAFSLSRGYEVIIIDYLQIISPENLKTSRYEQVTQISMALHTFAQSCHVAVIALAQLARPEKRGGKATAPTMHDIRESGQIEQDADAILMLFHENPLTPSVPTRMLKVAKNKDGETFGMKLDFDGLIQTFSEHREENASDRRRKMPPYFNENDGSAKKRQLSFQDIPDDEPCPF